ncbi:hypothetical protein F4677DRAFT_278572 [Hypoxylon crocopeplum]|nr:hypothetical protein F4677DRAFT_278572 [Hypoxylon crocopeplum]
MNPSERRVPKRWTEEEDRILHDETQKQASTGNIKDWNRIAAKLPGRTNKDCRKRWVNKVCGSLKKGAWDDDEDERLLSAVEKYGQKWTLVANEVGFRSPDQCAKRWQSSLDPNLEHREWTTEEDELLMSLVQENGREWKMIQETNFTRRSTNELKNRYTGLSKRAKPTYNRGKSVDSTSSSNSELPDDVEYNHNGTGIVEMGDDMKGTRVDAATGFVGQGMSQDWVNMVDNPGMWMVQFGQGQASDTRDILPDVYPSESQGLMDLDAIDTQVYDKGTGLVSQENTMPADASGWPGLYDTGITPPEGDIQAQSSLLPDSLFKVAHGSQSGIEGLEATDLEDIDSVGRVSLVIDRCNRGTLHHLLNLTGSLRGRTRIEIDNEE